MTLNVVGSNHHLELLHNDVELRAWDVSKGDLRVKEQSLSLGSLHVASGVS